MYQSLNSVDIYMLIDRYVDLKCINDVICIDRSMDIYDIDR